MVVVLIISVISSWLQNLSTTPTFTSTYGWLPVDSVLWREEGLLEGKSLLLTFAKTLKKS